MFKTVILTYRENCMLHRFFADMKLRKQWCIYEGAFFSGQVRDDPGFMPRLTRKKSRITRNKRKTWDGPPCGILNTPM